MIDGFPRPPMDNPLVAPFWTWAAVGELRLPQRADGTFDWYPTTPAVEWVRLSGNATLFSWAIVMRPLDPAYAGITPYISAIVLPEGAHGVRLVTRLIDMRPDELEAGMPLVFRLADLGTPGPPTGITAPFFAPVR